MYSFSPDGRGLYFTSDRGGSPQIYRMPVDGGEAVRITFNSPYNVSARPSPDGRSLVLAVQPLDGWTELWRLGRDGTVQFRRKGPEQRVHVFVDPAAN